MNEAARRAACVVARMPLASLIRFVRAVLVASCFAPCAAQALVVPSDARTREGNAVSTHTGFDQVRFMQIYPASAVGAPRVIREVAWRRDGIYRKRQTLRYEWWHQQNAHAWSLYLVPFHESYRSGHFADAADRRLVFRRASLVLPDLPWRDAATQPFDVRFKLDTPYMHVGGALALDVEIDHARWNDWSPYALDAVRREYPEVQTRHFGGGPLRLFATNNEKIALQCFGARPSEPLIFILGLKPLPGPLHASPDLLMLRTTTTSGSARMELPFAPNIQFIAQAVQWTTAKPTWSPGVEVSMGRAPLDAWLILAAGFRKTNRYGLVERNTMLVTRFD